VSGFSQIPLAQLRG